MPATIKIQCLWHYPIYHTQLTFQGHELQVRETGSGWFRHRKHLLKGYYEADEASERMEKTGYISSKQEQATKSYGRTDLGRNCCYRPSSFIGLGTGLFHEHCSHHCPMETRSTGVVLHLPACSLTFLEPTFKSWVAASGWPNLELLVLSELSCLPFLSEHNPYSIWIIISSSFIETGLTSIISRTQVLKIKTGCAHPQSSGLSLPPQFFKYTDRDSTQTSASPFRTLGYNSHGTGGLN